MTDRTNVKLLVVDDETGFAEVLCKRMTRRGVHAMPVASGEEGVRLLRKHEFDVAIVDLKLQGMDGIEILKLCTILAPEMAVLMLTGHGSVEARNTCMKLGAASYLSKPVDFERLYLKVLMLGGAKVDA
ncbi:response regulator [Pseudodesulfovibrio sediminis]|uniref:Two-component system response regulator n=1 Tax=Pseudodesulfovibrio sediminis TaxID=2810563 RepID=A0ABM7P9J8_9BACT|nr:response regulator [Pseudodesulfovibrio sediminis]BCS89748.1 two-component system response regulator [Pseudodesulfovibrio sediminis]